MESKVENTYCEGDVDGAIQPVRKFARPDWLDTENKIFINKLNYVCENFEKSNKKITKIENELQRKHKPDIEEMQLKLRTFNDQFNLVKHRCETMKDDLPTMMRQMVEYCIDQRLEHRLKVFAKKEDLDEKISYKLDTKLFNDYKRTTYAADMTDVKEFKLNDRFHNLKQDIKGLVSPEMFDDAMRTKADDTKLVSLEQLVQQVEKIAKQNQIKVTEHYERFNKMQKDIKEEHMEKNSELRELVYKLDNKIVDLQEQLDAESSRSRSESDGTHTQDNDSVQSVRQSINAGESMDESILTSQLKSGEDHTPGVTFAEKESAAAGSSVKLQSENKQEENGTSSATGAQISKEQQDQLGALNQSQKLINPMALGDSPRRHTVCDKKTLESRKDPGTLLKVDIPKEPESALIKGELSIETHSRNGTNQRAKETGELNIKVDDSVSMNKELPKPDDQLKQVVTKIDMNQVEEIQSPTLINSQRQQKEEPSSPGVASLKSKYSMRKHGDRRSIRNTKKEGDDTSSLKSIGKIDLMNESKYNDKYSTSKYHGGGQSTSTHKRSSHRKSKRESSNLFEAKFTETVSEFRTEIEGLKTKLVHQNDQFSRIEKELNEFNDMDAGQKLEHAQRKLMRKAFVEFMTPFEMNINVEFKQIRKYVDETMNKQRDHNERINVLQKSLDEIKISLVRQLQNTGNENKLLDREITRMQTIDRIKVQNARNSYFNPDTGSLLPGLDKCGVTSLQASMNKTTQPGSVVGENWGEFQDLSQFGKVTQREVVTANESSGVCDRFGNRLNRQRVIITRSLEPSHVQSTGNQLSNRKAQVTDRGHVNMNGFLNQSIQNHDDSIMSTTANTRARPLKTAGNINIQNHTRTQSINNSLNARTQFGTVDIRNKQAPDAMLRIKLNKNKALEKTNEKIKNKVKNMELRRNEVLKEFKMK